MPPLSYSPSIGSQLRRGFFSSSLSRLSKLSILVLLVICLHIFNLVSTKLNTVSIRIWPLHLRSLVPKNKRAIVPFLWLGLIFGIGCRAVSVLSIIWTGSKTNLNLIFFLDSSKRLEHIVKGAILITLLLLLLLFTRWANANPINVLFTSLVMSQFDNFIINKVHCAYQVTT